jgi:hypothetical protein
MVLVVEHAPIDRAPMLEAFVVAALHEATTRDVGCIAFPRGEDTATRLLVASRATAAKARGWLDDGNAWDDVLIRLQPVVAK